MSPYASHVIGTGMVSKKNGAVKTFIDAFHHAQGTGPGSNDLHIFGQFFEQQVLSVSMRISYQDLGRSGFPSGLNGRINLCGHKFAKALVLKPGWAQLFPRHSTNHTFHIGRNKNFLSFPPHHRNHQCHR